MAAAMLGPRLNCGLLLCSKVGPSLRPRYTYLQQCGCHPKTAIFFFAAMLAPHAPRKTLYLVFPLEAKRPALPPEPSCSRPSVSMRRPSGQESGLLKGSQEHATQRLGSSQGKGEPKGWRRSVSWPPLSLVNIFCRKKVLSACLLRK